LLLTTLNGRKCLTTFNDFTSLKWHEDEKLFVLIILLFAQNQRRLYDRILFSSFKVRDNNVRLLLAFRFSLLSDSTFVVKVSRKSRQQPPTLLIDRSVRLSSPFHNEFSLLINLMLSATGLGMSDAPHNRDYKLKC
jgi:hypothetical protein